MCEYKLRESMCRLSNGNKAKKCHIFCFILETIAFFFYLNFHLFCPIQSKFKLWCTCPSPIHQYVQGFGVLNSEHGQRNILPLLKKCYYYANIIPLLYSYPSKVALYSFIVKKIFVCCNNSRIISLNTHIESIMMKLGSKSIIIIFKK